MAWYFEDFHVGQIIETRARTITQADIAGFAGWSWDTNPVHTDAESAAESRFGEPIAHGMLGLSVAMGLVSGTGVFEGSSVALLGIDGWRFRAPIFAGDTVRCTVEITGARLNRTGESGILERKFTLLNQRDEVTQEGAIALMVERRPN